MGKSLKTHVLVSSPVTTEVVMAMSPTSKMVMKTIVKLQGQALCKT